MHGISREMRLIAVARLGSRLRKPNAPIQRPQCVMQPLDAQGTLRSQPDVVAKTIVNAATRKDHRVRKITNGCRARELKKLLLRRAERIREEACQRSDGCLGTRRHHLLDQPQPRTAEDVFNRNALIRQRRGGVPHKPRQRAWPQPGADHEHAAGHLRIEIHGSRSHNLTLSAGSGGSFRNRENDMGADIGHDSPRAARPGSQRPEVLDSMA